MAKAVTAPTDVVETGELVVKETAKLLTPKVILAGVVLGAAIVTVGVIVKKRKAVATETTEASESAAE